MICRRLVISGLATVVISISTDTLAQSRAVSTNTLPVTMTITASSNPPVFSGKTNLPDGTKLSVALIGQPPECVPRCGFGFPISTVQNGQFTIGSELTGAQKLIPATYTLSIISFGSHQPPNVQAIIGRKGENLRGPYIFAVAPKNSPVKPAVDGGKYMSVNFPWHPDPSSEEYILGLLVHFTQKITIP